MLHLVGETIDAKRAHLRAQAGELVSWSAASMSTPAGYRGDGTRPRRPHRALSLSRGLPVVGERRPARPDAGRAAVHQRAPQPAHPPARSRDRPERGARTSFDGQRHRRRRHGRTAPRASSPRQRFLEAFRLRSEHATAVTEPMRAQMAARLIEEHGSPQAAAERSGRSPARTVGTGKARGPSAICWPGRKRTRSREQGGAGFSCRLARRAARAPHP